MSFSLSQVDRCVLLSLLVAISMMTQGTRLCWGEGMKKRNTKKSPLKSLGSLSNCEVMDDTHWFLLPLWTKKWRRRSIMCNFSPHVHYWSMERISSGCVVCPFLFRTERTLGSFETDLFRHF